MNLITMTSICMDRYVNNLGQETALYAGGESLNFATNCCQYDGLTVHLLGAVGTDDYGTSILSLLKNYPIDISHLHIAPGVTANNITYLTENGELYYKPDSWTGGVYETFRLLPEDFDLIKSADIVHTSINCPVFSDILTLKKEYSFCLTVDFNTCSDYDKFEKFLPYINILFISGNADTEQALSAWSLTYSGIFIATYAEKGSVAWYNGRRYPFSADKVSEIVDTTGCGDSFQAGFIADWLIHKNIPSAMKEGKRLATETLSHFGGARAL